MYNSHSVYTIGTLFSGGEGVGCGARAAGLHHLWGIEIDDAVAQVARDNGFGVETADILKVNPAKYGPPTVLHASPPCPNFSNAKQGRRESDYDIALAKTVAEFINLLLPLYFTLENVWGYRKSVSWAIIRDALYGCGYWFDLAHVNAANFGVPQTRKRMIVRAALRQMVQPLPLPEPWIGWHEAIEDLIPALPESQFAPWQLKRMPEKLRETILLAQGSFDHTNEGNERQAQPIGRRRASGPSFTIVGNSNMLGMRAFLVGGQFARPANKSDEPRPAQVRERDGPIFTVTAQNKGDWRAWLEQGRVVQMTPRALARFQAFPDSYILPGNKVLACKVIGMAVPPLLYQKIVGQLVELRGDMRNRHP